MGLEVGSPRDSKQWADRLAVARYPLMTGSRHEWGTRVLRGRRAVE